MRPLSATLLAAQKSAISTPAVGVVVRPRLGAATKLKWTALYQGLDTPNCHAAAAPSDGSLIRAAIIGGTLYRQRCAIPGFEGPWDTWTAIEACSTAGVGMASAGSRVVIFWAQPDHKTIRYLESTDNGANWSGPTTLYVTTNSCYHLAPAMQPNGDIALFYFEWTSIYCVTRVSSVWGAPIAYPYSPAIVSGLAANYKSHTRVVGELTYQWDWNVVVTGRNADNQRAVWTFMHGSQAGSPVWTDLKPVLLADYTGIDYRSPFLCIDGAIHRLTFTEVSTSGQNYERVFITFQIPEAEGVSVPPPATFIENLWHEPWPFHPGNDYLHYDDLFYGLALVANADHAYLAAPDAVWQAPTQPTPLTLTERVLQLRQTVHPVHAGASQAMVEMENADLSLSPHWDQGSWVTPIETDQELEISPGYRTSVGDETSPGPSHWISRVTTTSQPSRSTVVIAAAGPEYLLQNTAIRWQKTWASGEATVVEILAWILSRAGFPLYIEGASTFAQTFQPAFRIPAGQDCLTALRRDMSLCGDVLKFHRATAILTTPNGYYYQYRCPSQPGIHPLYAGRYDQTAMPANWANAWGTLTPLITADEMTPQINEQYGRLATLSDLNLDSQADATDHARAAMTQRYRLTSCGQVIIPPNCGLELWDVLSIQDYRVAIFKEWRAMSIDFTYERDKRSAYRMAVDLCPLDYPQFKPT